MGGHGDSGLGIGIDYFPGIQQKLTVQSSPSFGIRLECADRVGLAGGMLLTGSVGQVARIFVALREGAGDVIPFLGRDKLGQFRHKIMLKSGLAAQCVQHYTTSKRPKEGRRSAQTQV